MEDSALEILGAFQHTNAPKSASNAPVNHRAVWGNMLTCLREKREIGLHISCSTEAVPLWENGKLVVEVATDFAFEMLSDPSSQSTLTSAFASAQYYGAFEVRKKQYKKSQLELDLERIAFLSGDKLKKV